MARQTVIIFILLLLQPLPAPAWDFGRLRYNNQLRRASDRVMPGLVANSIIQDEQGFMWFGTANGLVRFDGNDTRIYHYPGRNKQSSVCFVSTITLDSKNNIWIGTWKKGAARFNPKTQAFVWFRHDPENENSLSSDNVWQILEDRQGRIWIGGCNGLDLLDPADGRILKQIDFKKENCAVHQKISINCLLQDHAGTIWVGTGKTGLFSLDSNTFELKRYTKELPGQSGRNNLPILGLYEDGADVLWVSVPGGLWTLSPDRALAEKRKIQGICPADHLLITKYSGDIPGKIIAGSADGMVVIDLGTMKKQLLLDGLFCADHIWSGNILSFYPSPDGLIWFSSEKGLDYVFLQDLAVKHIHKVIGTGNTLSGYTVGAMCRGTNGRIWLGTEHGLDMYDSLTGRLQPIELGPGPDKEGRIDTGTITALSGDTDGNIWICTRDGVYKYLNRSGRIVFLPDLTEKVRQSPGDYIIGVVSGQNRQTWFASRSGSLVVYNAQTREYDRVLPRANLPETLLGPVYAMQIDTRGVIWLALDNGFARYFPETGTVKHFRHSTADKGISLGRVFTIFRDRDDDMWLGTDHGLERVDLDGRRMLNISVMEGLPCNRVYALAEDRDGILWLGTEQGLAAYNKKFGIVEKNNILNMFRGMQFSLGASLATQDGQICFGSSNGLLIFTPGDMVSADGHHHLFITGMELNGKPLSVGDTSALKTAVSYTGGMDLDHRQNSFRLFFSALGNSFPEEYRYSYRLDPVDADWVDTGYKDRMAAYSNLGPGVYQFHLRAGNLEKGWRSHEKHLRITIHPPWWQTWWFRLSAIVVAAFIVFQAFWYKVRQYKKQNSLLELSVRQRTLELQKSREQYKSMYAVAKAEKKRAEQALESERMALKQDLNFVDMISHEYRTPVSIINSGLDFLERKIAHSDYTDMEQLLDAMREAGRRLLNIFESALHEKRINNRNLYLGKETVCIRQLVENAIKFNRHVYPGHAIEFKDNKDGSLWIEGDGEMLMTGISNLIDNACKYSHKTKTVQVTVALTDGHVSITVFDQGCGIREDELGSVFEKYFRSRYAENKPGAGVGLFLVKKIVELHGGTISIESKWQHATTVTVNLPAALRLKAD